MMEALKPHINTAASLDDDEDELKIVDPKGEKPPMKPLTPTRSHSYHQQQDDSFETASECESVATVELNSNLSLTSKPVQSQETVSEDKSGNSRSIFSLGKIASSITPVATSYLSYFVKPAPISNPTTTQSVAHDETTTANEISEMEEKETDVEGGIIDPDSAKNTADLSKRTWSEWANEKTVGLVAKEYLDMLQELHAVEIDIPARSMCRAPFLVAKGSAIIWQVRIRQLDLGFAVRLRRQGLGGAVEDEIVPMKRYKAGDLIVGGRAAVDYTRHIVFVFDNTYSTLRAKKCCHRVQVGPHLVSEDETVLAAPDVMASPFEKPADGLNPNPNHNQLAALSALLTRAKDSYGVVLERAKAAKDVSLGAVQGGIGAAALAPRFIQQAIVASLRRTSNPSTAATESEKTGASEATVDTETETGGEGPAEDAVAVPTSEQTLPALDMANFCALWVQLEEGSQDVSSTVIPRQSIEEGFPLVTLPKHLTDVAAVEVIASGEVNGGCQIFGYCIAPNDTSLEISEGPSDSLAPGAVEKDKADDSPSGFYVLMEMNVIWRGPSQESPGYDEWSLQATLRTTSPNKAILKETIERLKLSEAFFIIV